MLQAGLKECDFMKLGIIRCMQTEDYCPGTADFKAVREKTGAFAEVATGKLHKYFW